MFSVQWTKIMVRSLCNIYRHDQNHSQSKQKRKNKKEKINVCHWVTARPYSSDTEKTVLYRGCDKSAVAFRPILFLFLPRTIARSNRHRQNNIPTEWERDKSERENGAGSAGHYLLLTIFMRLSIAEISTRCDDIDWHAVKPSDMRLRRSPPTPIRPFSPYPLPTL